jgi:hypothetical protein
MSHPQRVEFRSLPPNFEMDVNQPQEWVALLLVSLWGSNNLAPFTVGLGLELPKNHRPIPAGGSRRRTSGEVRTLSLARRRLYVGRVTQRLRMLTL